MLLTASMWERGHLTAPLRVNFFEGQDAADSSSDGEDAAGISFEGQDAAGNSSEDRMLLKATYKRKNACC